MQYNLKHYNQSDISPLILAINTLGKNLIGLELGVFRAKSLITILHNCDIQKLYGVDNWLPYEDYLKGVPDGKPAYRITERDQELNKFNSYHLIKHADPENKIKIIEKDSLEAVKEIEDNSLDFIFFDAMMTEEQTYNEAMAYYPKIKKNGLFTGHDAMCYSQVIKPIKKVKEHYSNHNSIISYSDCFMFKI